MNTRRRPGRPRIASARYQVRLPPQIARAVRRYGDGSLSRGLIKLAQLAVDLKCGDGG